jgi:hypothetical protein
MIGRKMMQIQRIISVIVIMTRPDTAIIMISDTETELIEKGDSMKLWKRALEKGKIIGKHCRRKILRNLCTETSVTS